MRKIMLWFLCLALIPCAAAADDTAADTVFESFGGMEWSFCSGAGGWSTDMRFLPDGSFSGEYHDSEMGESTDAYPGGTIYCCSFTGQMRVAEQVSETVWNVTVETLKTDSSQEEEAVDDGIRYVKAEPYGLSAGDRMTLYAPGTPLDAFTEDMLLWAHLMDPENRPDTLQDWFLYSEKNDSGFVGIAPAEPVGIANPWEDMDADRLKEVSGLVFGVPEGAQDILFRYMAADGLAEMQFTIDGDEYCARILPAALEEGELMNIAGMYFAWDHEEPVTVCGCAGTLAQAQTGSEDWVELCQWYDREAGLMYALSVATTDLDGLDLTAVAEQCMP